MRAACSVAGHTPFTQETDHSDIVKRNGGQMTEWSPLRACARCCAGSPFREMAPTFPVLPGLERMSFNPTFDVTETRTAYTFKADVPASRRRRSRSPPSGTACRSAANRDSEHEAKTDTVYTYERQYGSFVRSFTLADGADIDHAKSELKDGVLTLVIPKKAGAQAKRSRSAAALRSVIHEAGPGRVERARNLLYRGMRDPPVAHVPTWRLRWQRS